MSLEINDEIIEDDLIAEELGVAAQGRTLTPEAKEKLLQEVKENLIYKTLLRQESEKLEVEISQEHIDREYRLFFTETPPDEEWQVKKYIEGKLKESILIDRICEDITPPQEKHLRSFFEDNREHYFVAREFHYREYGFRYPRAELHPRLHEHLTRLREALTQNPHWREVDPLSVISISEDGDSFFSRDWKITPGELTAAGLEFLQRLEEEGFSRITDHAGESLLYTPVKQEAGTPYLGFFAHLQTREQFLPDFEEISSRVASDLWEEMRQIKLRAHLRRIMEKSKIRDISYI